MQALRRRISVHSHLVFRKRRPCRVSQISLSLVTPRVCPSEAVPAVLRGLSRGPRVEGNPASPPRRLGRQSQRDWVCSGPWGVRTCDPSVWHGGKQSRLCTCSNLASEGSALAVPSAGGGTASPPPPLFSITHGLRQSALGLQFNASFFISREPVSPMFPDWRNESRSPGLVHSSWFSSVPPLSTSSLTLAAAPEAGLIGSTWSARSWRREMVKTRPRAGAGTGRRDSNQTRRRSPACGSCFCFPGRPAWCFWLP